MNTDSNVTDMNILHITECFSTFSVTFHKEYKRSNNETGVRHIGKMVSEQSDEIYGVKKIGWENSSWKHLSLIGDEQIISFQRTKVYVFSDFVLCLGKILEEHPIARCMGRKIGMVQIICGLHKL